MFRSFKIRLYPTKKQEQLMWKHIHCCRYIWNYMIDLQENLYNKGEKHLSAFSMMNRLKPLKNDGEHGWLYEVSNKSLQIVCKDLEQSYQLFFRKKAKFPKFKSRKKSKYSFPICSEQLYFKDMNVLNVQKVGKVKYKTDFNFPFGTGYKYINARISYINNKWILSFSIECENQTLQLTDKFMGIDLGIKELAVVAFGEERLTFNNINKSKKIRNLKQKLKHLQRRISRKYEANRNGMKYVKTNNIVKLENELRKIYIKISNIRNNYINQTTHMLVSMLPSRVVMEDLNVKDMMNNRYLSKYIQEQCFGEFSRQMEYKCERYGIEFIKADRFYPSSKTCSACGSVKHNLKLSDRTYVCESCGLVIDRDYNAAINLSRYIV